MYYDVHLLAPNDWADPRGALARAAARALHERDVDPTRDLPPRRPRRPGPTSAQPPAAAPAPQPPAAAPAPQPPAAATLVGPDVLERVRATWVRPEDGLRIEAGATTLLVRLPYWYVGREARTHAKVLHAVVADLEKESGRRGYDPQLSDWFTGRDAADTAAVLDAVADFQARERVDSPAVDAIRAQRAASGRRPRLGIGRRRS
jgi:hypothetical protein